MANESQDFFKTWSITCDYYIWREI